MDAIINPEHPDAPKYWRYEVGGQLGLAIERYLLGKGLSEAEVGLIRWYLRQWIDSPVWDMNPSADDEQRRALAELRASARLIRTREHIRVWLRVALEIGIDPL